MLTALDLIGTWILNESSEARTERVPAESYEAQAMKEPAEKGTVEEYSKASEVQDCRRNKDQS